MVCALLAAGPCEELGPEEAGAAPPAPQGMGMLVEAHPGFMGRTLGPCRIRGDIVSLGSGWFPLF